MDEIDDMMEEEKKEKLIPFEDTRFAGTDEEWLGLVYDRDEIRSYRGRGYRDGLQGIRPICGLMSDRHRGSFRAALRRL